MHRMPLLKLLERYEPCDAQDNDCRERFAGFVRKHDNCFERSLEVGHVTGAAWLVDPTGCRVLLTHHRKLNCWLQLGGHADGDPDVLNVALREAEEESGIADIAVVQPSIFDLDIHTIPAYGGVPAHEHYDVRFLLQARSEDRLIVSDESNDLAWFTVADLDAMELDDSIRQMQRKWLQSSQPAATG